MEGFVFFQKRRGFSIMKRRKKETMGVGADDFEDVQIQVLQMFVSTVFHLLCERS